MTPGDPTANGLLEYSRRTGGIIITTLDGVNLSNVTTLTLNGHGSGHSIVLGGVEHGPALLTERLGLANFQGGVVRLLMCNPGGITTEGAGFGERLGNLLEHRPSLCSSKAMEAGRSGKYWGCV